LEEAQRLALRAVEVQRLVADHVPTDDRQTDEQEEDAAHDTQRAEEELQQIEAATALRGHGCCEKKGDHRRNGYHVDRDASNHATVEKRVNDMFRLCTLAVAAMLAA